MLRTLVFLVVLSQVHIWTERIIFPNLILHTGYPETTNATDNNKRSWNQQARTGCKYMSGNNLPGIKAIRGQSTIPDQSLSVQQPPIDQSSAGQSLGGQSSAEQSLTGQSSATQTSGTIECPAIRRIPTTTIGNCAAGPGRMDCPTGAQCLIDTANGVSFCCWEETSVVSSPCSYPLMRGSDFATCDRFTPCPGGRCYRCHELRGLTSGLCCPTYAEGCPAAPSITGAGTTFVGGAGTTFMGGAGSAGGGVVIPGGTGVVDPRFGAVAPGGIRVPDPRFGAGVAGGVRVTDPRFGAAAAGGIPRPVMMGEFCYGRTPALGFCMGPFGCPPYARCVRSSSGRGICCPVRPPMIGPFPRRFPIM